MAYDEFLADRVRNILRAKRADADEKKMFGGLCFLVDEKMCVGVEGDRLMVRIDPDAYEDALERPGTREMKFTGKPMKGFVFVEVEGTKSAASLQSWVQMALDFNPKAKASKSRKAKTY